MKIPDTGIVSDEDLSLFRDEGYMLLREVISPEMLELLREECSYFLGYFDALLDVRDERSPVGLSQRGKRYFISNRYRYSSRLWRFIFGDLMAEVCYKTLGPNAYLFNEQWVVKGAEKGMKFAWHQDSGYVKFVDAKTDHPPYLTCWCTLDDVSEANGTVYVMPHSRGGTKGNIHTHFAEEGTNDLVGYQGDDPGVAIELPAGSLAVFSSYNLHRSGPNTTDHMRRVYLPQYVSETIRLAHNGERLNMNVPFIQNGEIVYDHNRDTAERWGGAAAPEMPT